MDANEEVKRDEDRLVDNGPPRVHVRWFHAGPPTLLSSVPIATGPTPVWQPLTREESDACEDAWQELLEEEKAGSSTSLGSGGIFEHDDTRVGIPVSKEKLFEVDVRSMRNKPVENTLAERLEKAYRVVQPWQAGQFEHVPSYEAELQRALEIGVEGLEKLKTPLVPASEEPNTTNKPDTYVVFEDAAVARVITGPIRKSFASMLAAFTTRGKPTPPHPSQLGGLVYYRGSDEAAARIKASQTRPQSPDLISRSPSVSSMRSAGHRGRKSEQLPAGQPNPKRARVKSLPAENLSDATDRGRPAVSDRLKIEVIPPAEAEIGDVPQDTTAGDPVGVVNPEEEQEKGPQNRIIDAKPIDEMSSVTDLILVIHGIGQGLTLTYEAFDFVYATNMLREVARVQAQTPAISSIMRDRRVQFLPVQWRASLKLDMDKELLKQREGLDNHFTLDDITLKNTIPNAWKGRFVRDLTNQVLMDIPLFMSHHRARMIESVCTLANRSYRLWCARNPDFERNGRVHIVAHSLGSALVANILSNQPTVQVPLSQMSDETKATKSQFVFNTSNLFLAGSPLGVFIHLNQAQIIARKGRARTMQSPSDEALDRTGIFGCMAVDAVYNIFNPADPVVYLLNPCVDAELAKKLPATAIPNVTEGYISSFSNMMSKMFNNISIPLPSFFPSGTAGPSSASAKPVGGTTKNVDAEGDVEMELAAEGEPEALRGTKAERRFAALNPHGTLDYYLPSGTGNISEYVDMITAHSAYWSDDSLAAFVLAETFATSADYLRTDIGVTTMPTQSGS
ncbi:hypothetical protein FRB99_008880 [Tulasnella sp. 403]|nr:hypothetical protein FRB99_008880 [Tulasnella sp. 403]